MREWFLLLGLGLAWLQAAQAQPQAFVPVASDVRYQLIDTWSVERFKQVLGPERAAFSGVQVAFAVPRYAVKLYRVIHATTVPEQDNRPTEISGLVAVPEGVATTMPVVSYQHGTIFGSTDVPSNPDRSMETRMMLAQFAAQGYVVVATDYIGKGVSKEPDSYMLKDSTQQACVDMLRASRHVLAALKVQTGPLFLSGWSQGGWATMNCLRRLEAIGVKVTAAATASAPSDLHAAMQRWIYNPQPVDAVYLPAIAGMYFSAVENYHRLDGLVRSAVRPAYVDAVQALYAGTLAWEAFRARTPPRMIDFLREDFVAQGPGAQSLGRQTTSPFWKLVEQSEAYRWRSRVPLHIYYGEQDEVTPVPIALLPQAYQSLIGGAPTESFSAGARADHRATFIYSVSHQKAWFDSFVANSR